MRTLIFEDNEVDNLIEAVNKLQLLFHPTMMGRGEITANEIMKLSQMNSSIIIDSNILSPIYELAKYGTTKNKEGLQISAILVIFSKIINARITGGFALIENESNSYMSISSDEKEQFFLHAVDNIPLMIWKEIAWGYTCSVPEYFIFKEVKPKKTDVYQFSNNEHYLMHKIAILEMVYLIKLNGYNFDNFYNFLEWYIDNFIICESIILYAAMIFSSMPKIKPPKNLNSFKLDKIIKGVENQAWDIFYLSYWSTLYSNEKTDKTIFLFATNDVTLKHLLINSFPIGNAINSVYLIFNTVKQKNKLDDLLERKLGENRIKPFDTSNKKEMLEKLNILLENEIDKLKTIL